MVRLFENIQKVIEAGRRIQVSVPASKALIITNKTKEVVNIYQNSSNKIGYPLEPKESLEVEYIDEEAIFHVEILDNALSKNEGLFLISQTGIFQQPQNTSNTVVIKKN